jgi:hypothetical protein
MERDVEMAQVQRIKDKRQKSKVENCRGEREIGRKGE